MNTEDHAKAYDFRMHTYSGGKTSLVAPKEEEILEEDIICALANQCRYGGHIKDIVDSKGNLVIYSVAQHSILVAGEVARRGNYWKAGERIILMAALLHDAAEAYLGDVKSPLKALLPAYRQLEEEFLKVIYKKFHIPIELINDEHIKAADHYLLLQESIQLLNGDVSWWGQWSNGEYSKEITIPIVPKSIDVVRAEFRQKLMEYQS